MKLKELLEQYEHQSFIEGAYWILVHLRKLGHKKVAAQVESLIEANSPDKMTNRNFLLEQILEESKNEPTRLSRACGEGCNGRDCDCVSGEAQTS